MTNHTDTPTKLALVAGIGMFLSTLDSGIINIAIPSLIKVFHSHISTVIWTVTLYTLVLSASILLFGRLADRVGRLKIYKLGLILFAISSILCGAANHIGELIAFRALQGLSAAMLQATAIALITTRLDSQNTIKAMGIFGMLIGLGPMMGPVIGGFILSSLGWRWIFWLNIPICLLGLYGCQRLTKVKEPLQQAPINYINLLLIALSLLSLLVTMSFISKGQTNTLFIMLIAIALLGLYFFSELKAKHPIIPLALFKQLKFSAPILGIIAFGGATALAFMLPPLYLEKLKGLEAWQVGFISLSAPLGIILSTRLSAKLVPKIGTLIPMLAGLSVMIIALLALTQISMAWPNKLIFLLLFLYGVGGGLFQTPCYLNIMAQFPTEKHAFISALVRMLQNLSIAFESAGAALLISLQKTDLLTGIQQGWWLSVIITIVALILLSFNLLTKKNHASTIGHQ